MSDNADSTSVCSTSPRPHVVMDTRNVVPKAVSKKTQPASATIDSESKPNVGNKSSNNDDTKSVVSLHSVVRSPPKAVLKDDHHHYDTRKIKGGKSIAAVRKASHQTNSTTSPHHVPNERPVSLSSSSVSSSARPVVLGYQKKRPDSTPTIATVRSSKKNSVASSTTKSSPFLSLSPSVRSTFPVRKEAEKDETSSRAFQRGQALYNAGNYEKAIPEYQKSISVRESVNGRYHSDTQRSYASLAECYSLQKDYMKCLAASAVEARIKLVLDSSSTSKASLATRNLAVALEKVRQSPGIRLLTTSYDSVVTSTTSVASSDTVAGGDDDDDLSIAVSVQTFSTSPLKLMGTEAECAETLKESISLERKGDSCRAGGDHQGALQNYREAIEAELRVFGADSATYAYLCRKRLCISLLLASDSINRLRSVDWSKVDLMHATTASWWVKSLMGKQQDTVSEGIPAVSTIDPQVFRVLAAGDEYSSACHFKQAAEEYRRANNLANLPGRTNQTEQQHEEIDATRGKILVPEFDRVNVVDEISKAQLVLLQKHNDELLREVRDTTDELSKHLVAEQTKYLDSFGVSQDQRIDRLESSWTKVLQSTIEQQHDAFAKDNEVLSQAKHERLIREVKSATEALDNKLISQYEEQIKSTKLSQEKQLEQQESMLREMIQDLLSKGYEDHTNGQKEVFKSQSEHLLEQVMAATNELESKIAAKQSKSLQSVLASQQQQFDQHQSKLKESLDDFLAEALKENAQAKTAFTEAQHRSTMEKLMAGLHKKLDSQYKNQIQAIVANQRPQLDRLGLSISDSLAAQQQNSHTQTLEEMSKSHGDLQASVRFQVAALEKKLIEQQEKDLVSFEASQHKYFSDIQSNVQDINKMISDEREKQNVTLEGMIRSQHENLLSAIASRVKETGDQLIFKQQVAMQDLSASQQRQIDEQKGTLVDSLTDVIEERDIARSQNYLEKMLATKDQLDTSFRERQEKGIEKILSSQKQLYEQHRDHFSSSSVVDQVKAEWDKHAHTTNEACETLFRNQQEEVLRRLTEKVAQMEDNLAKMTEANFQSFEVSQQKKFEDYLARQSKTQSSEWKAMQVEQEERLGRKLTEETPSHQALVKLVEGMAEASQAHTFQQQQRTDMVAEQVNALLSRTEDLSIQLSALANNQAQIDSNLSKLADIVQKHQSEQSSKKEEQPKQQEQELALEEMVAITDNERTTSRSICIEKTLVAEENERDMTKQSSRTSSFVISFFMYLAMAFIVVPVLLFVYTNRTHVLSFVHNITETLLLPPPKATEILSNVLKNISSNFVGGGNDDTTNVGDNVDEL